MMKKIILIFITIVFLGRSSIFSLIFGLKPKEKKEDSTYKQITEQQENNNQTTINQKENQKTEKQSDVISTIDKISETKQASQEIQTPKTQQKQGESRQIQENSTPQVINTQSPIVETPVEKTSEPTIEPTQTQETKYEEKWVRNDAMIETIRKAIIDNESDLMKQYGYTIVVDSSIKANTNPFTFTVKRLNRLLNTACGTIKIYAEDYYVNGEFIMTESYVL